MKKRVVAIIPARYQSSRFPGKPLANLLGKPMLSYVCQQTMKAEYVDEVLVATDSVEIMDRMVECGFSVIMTSSEHPSGTDRVAEAAEHVQAEIIINVQGDEPLIQPESIDLLAQAFLTDDEMVYGQLVKKIEDPRDLIDTNTVKAALSGDGYILFYSRSPIPYPKVPSHFEAYKHVGVYGFRRPFLKTFTSLKPLRLELTEGIEQLRAIEHGYKVRAIVTPYDTISVDTPFDLKEVEKIMLS